MAPKIAQNRSGPVLGTDSRTTLRAQRMQELEIDYLQNLKHLQRVFERARNRLKRLNKLSIVGKQGQVK